MSKITIPVVLLRILLAALFAFLLLMQVMSFPGEFSDDPRDSPQSAGISILLLVVGELGALCLQVVIVCTWQLLTLVARDRIFSPASMGWVNGILGAFLAGWLLLTGTAAYLTAFIFFTPEERDPGVPVVLFGIVLIATVLLLLMVVLRALLRQATTLRADMEEVI